MSAQYEVDPQIIFFLNSSLQIIYTFLPQESAHVLCLTSAPLCEVCYLIIVGQELVLNNSEPDTEPENETKNLVHDVLFSVDEDEH